MTQTQAAQAFEKHTAQVQSAFPSLFTKEDVIKVLRALQDDLDFEDEDSEFLTQEQLDGLREDICNKVENKIERLYSDDLVDLDSAELELNGDRISVISIEVNTSTIVDEISTIIDDVFREVKVKETTES
jgi:hypothetical protein